MVVLYKSDRDDRGRAPDPGCAYPQANEPVMPIHFRKTSIRSRKRTLGLAALGLIVDAIVSHPRVDVSAMVNVAMMSRFAAAPLMASLGSLSRTASTDANDITVPIPVASPEDVAWMCARARRSQS